MPLTGYPLGTRPIDAPSQSIMPDVASQRLCLFQSIDDRSTLATFRTWAILAACQFPTQRYDAAANAGQVGHVLRGIGQVMRLPRCKSAIGII